MRITICELPHEPAALADAWAALCNHTRTYESELVLLPEFAMVEPVWECELFDAERWAAVEMRSNEWLARLPELEVPRVIGARPMTIGGKRYNQGFIWSDDRGFVPLRAKYHLPDELELREARWFERGDATFPTFHSRELSFGLNICTELWALESYAGYAEQGAQVIFAPRATAADTLAKWFSIGVVGAVRSGAYSVSSNRVDPNGNYGGVGWIISPEGRVLASTTADAPFATLDIELGASVDARDRYPVYVFRGQG